MTYDRIRLVYLDEMDGIAISIPYIVQIEPEEHTVSLRYDCIHLLVLIGE
ncbi:hypothetical protein RND71_026449 [Anisodus tanguticus]|uniref:Uncharacterized protein n=1 Tax=Anisodus tanguticus TaxID=243964 RepID=A0AAE1RME3_9SOLA|nr:hypothetical protein RND71_026449 [Anisodus tanguticus]